MSEERPNPGGTRREAGPAPDQPAGGTRRETGPAPDQPVGGTRREAGPAPDQPAGGTRREVAQEPNATPGGTRREASAAGQQPGAASDGDYGETILLPSLRERYRYVSELKGGAEAQVVRAVESESGREVLIKQYSKGIVPDVDALQKIQDLDSELVASLYDFGSDPASTRFYEIQEWIDGPELEGALSGGTLKASARDVLKLLVQSVSDYHAAGLIHRDIKPSNLLIASEKPLRIVLIDFGLAKTLRGTKRMTTVAGTIEYRAPESIHSGGLVAENRQALDWWSVGIIAAETHLGRSFFALPDGSSRNEAEIEAMVRDQKLEFHKLDDDPHLQHLCRGLLTHDFDERWTGEQVSLWLTNPDDPSLTVAKSQGNVPVRERTVHFHGEHTDPAQLAEALQQNWAEAAKKLFNDPSERLVGEIRQMAQEYKLEGVLDILGSVGAGMQQSNRVVGEKASRRLANLLVQLDSDLKPIYDGIDLRPGALVSIADPQQAARQDEIFNNEILLAWRGLPSMENAAELHERWGELRTEVDEITSKMKNIDPELPKRASGQALALAVDEPASRKMIHKRLRGRALRSGQTNKVLKQLSKRSASSAQLAVAAALAPDAAKYAVDSGAAPAPAGAARFGTPVFAIALSAVFAFLLVATGVVDQLTALVTGPAVVALLAGSALVAWGGVATGNLLLKVVAGLGLLLAFWPEMLNGFFYSGDDRFAGALIALPGIALLIHAANSIWLGFLARSGALIGGLFVAALGFGAPLTGDAFDIQIEPQVAQGDVDESVPARPSTVPTTTTLGTAIDGPCFLAQLATLDTEAEALDTAERFDDLSSASASSSASVIGPSDWLPGWSPGRFVVFQRFETEDEARSLIADLGSAASGAGFISLPEGAEACG